MRGFCGNDNGPTTKALAELNHRTLDEHKEVRDGVAYCRQGLSEEDESRINEDGDGVNCRRIELVATQPVMTRPQQPPQGPQVPVITWERFLPRRSIKVLLVENDYSTRHVVSALLRNCCYEVMAVANGLEAWKIVEDLTNHIDLVLTEVDMPHISGIGLLWKIMNHKTCKNIPVIMMSSNDSMGIVFKCLSKGAVDFLVKPIRKNELKNLWQHVWRKCHSSSGSGSASESGIRTKKSTKLKSDEESDNNSGSNDEADNVSIGLVVRDGSDDGSATQSSWTKRTVADPRANTCAQVIHSNSDEFSNNWVPKTATEKYQEQDDENGKITDLDVNKNVEKLEKGTVKLNTGTPNGESMTKAANLLGVLNNGANPQMESVATEIPKDIPKITSIKDKAIHDSKEIPSLALSLKTTTNFDDYETCLREQNVLRHSDLSAFSRYNTNPTANQAPNGNNTGISCSPLDISSEVAKTKSNCTLFQRSDNSSNNNDMGSTTNNRNKLAAFTDNPMPQSSVNLDTFPAYKPLQNGHVSSIQPVKPGNADGSTVGTLPKQARGSNQQVQVQHHHHHYHHHHHHVHNSQQNQQQQQLPNPDDVASGDNDAGPHCGPSNVVLSTTPIEGNAANYSLNESASGSNNGSNGQNGSGGQSGSSSAVIAVATNMARDNGTTAGKFSAGSGSGSISGVDQNQFAQREAALNKFRQKRKERCFDKKVRYQSRKKLAEQRPRVRGQFVRQIVVVRDNKIDDTNNS